MKSPRQRAEEVAINYTGGRAKNSSTKILFKPLIDAVEQAILDDRKEQLEHNFPHLEEMYRQIMSYAIADDRKELIEKMRPMYEELKWITQTIHQAHHRDGTKETCKVATCQSAVKILSQLKGVFEK